MRTSNKIDKDLKIATQIQDQAYTAIDKALNELAIKHKDKFPENPSLLPSLYVASMCLYINSIINSFPDDCRSNLIMLVCKSLGFEDISVDINNSEIDLATMEVAGHA